MLSSKKQLTILFAFMSTSVAPIATCADTEEASQSSCTQCFGMNLLRDTGLIAGGALIQGICQSFLFIEGSGKIVSKKDKLAYLTTKVHGLGGIFLMGAFLFVLAALIEWMSVTFLKDEDENEEVEGFNILRAVRYFVPMLLGAWMINMFVIREKHTMKIDTTIMPVMSVTLICV